MSKLFRLHFTLVLCLLTLIQIGCQSKTSRELKVVTFSGSGYELGLQHGKELKSEIEAIIRDWKENSSASLGRDADLILDEFFQYSDFTESIKKWTPDLYEEVRGIADGSGQKFNDIFVLNLLDEFWVFVNNQKNHHCSALGVPARNENPGYISQNMDLENYTDGYQVLMRLEKTDDRPEQLILTHPGLIALNGLNETGIGICVNTLMQLQASPSGLPVAFVVRRIINSTDKDELLSFIQKVPHASGQNYLFGIRGEVFDYEASSNKVVQFNPGNDNGTVYHTNHPIVNDDVKPWFALSNPALAEENRLTSSNSHIRLSAVEKRMTSENVVSVDLIKETLRSKDDRKNPVCRTNQDNGGGFTFASIIMEHSIPPRIEILAGPPDESEFQTFSFTEK